MPYSIRLTAKDRGLIKGAIRRAFARSELHKAALARYTIEHSDPINHPRCVYWGWCAECGEVMPRHKLELDHTAPIIPVNTTFEQMSLDEVVDRTWCMVEGLRALCPRDHKIKTAQENALRPKKPKKPRKSRTKKLDVIA